MLGLLLALSQWLCLSEPSNWVNPSMLAIELILKSGNSHSDLLVFLTGSHVVDERSSWIGKPCRVRLDIYSGKGKGEREGERG